MTARGTSQRKALVVHGDLSALSGLQDGLASSGFEVISARDLPTALLTVTLHYFELIVVCSRITEEGDGWPLAGVMHMIFPSAHIAVIAPDKNVIALQAAINHGANQVFQFSNSPGEIVGSILKRFSAAGKRVQ